MFSTAMFNGAVDALPIAHLPGPINTGLLFTIRKIPEFHLPLAYPHSAHRPFFCSPHPLYVLLVRAIFGSRVAAAAYLSFSDSALYCD